MKIDHLAPPVNPSVNPSFEQIVARAISRRTILKSGLGVATLPFFGALAACGSGGGVAGGIANVVEQAMPLRNAFAPVAASSADAVVVADGYVAEVLYRWGDPLTNAVAHQWRGDATESWVEQENQAGDNHDGISFFPLASNGRHASESGLLAMNHEHVNYEYLFAPGLSLIHI